MAIDEKKLLFWICNFRICSRICGCFREKELPESHGLEEFMDIVPCLEVALCFKKKKKKEEEEEKKEKKTMDSLFLF